MATLPQTPNSQLAIGYGSQELGVWVIFDASVEQSIDRVSVVSEYAIENGANIADHVRPRPNIFKTKAIVSMTPALDAAALGARTVDYVSTAIDTLISFRDNATPVDVVSAKEHLTNMIVTRIAESYTWANGNDFEADITCEQISVAQAQYVNAPKPAKPIATTKKDIGTKQPPPADASQSPLLQAGKAVVSMLSGSNS